MKNQNSGGYVPSAKEKNVFEVDPTLSHLEWCGKKIGGEHAGTISLTNGRVFSENGNISGSFEVDMSSIVSTDLQGEWKEKLEGHLRSEDFFGTDKYPKAKFEITSAIPIENQPGRYALKGDLTIKASTHLVAFIIDLNMEETRMEVYGEIVVDRSKYDVRYGSKSFFANIGDKMIHDEFQIKFKIVALK